MNNLAKQLKPQIKAINGINLEITRTIQTLKVGKCNNPLKARHYALKDNLHKFSQK